MPRRVSPRLTFPLLAALPTTTEVVPERCALQLTKQRISSQRQVSAQRLDRLRIRERRQPILEIVAFFRHGGWWRNLDGLLTCRAAQVLPASFSGARSDLEQFGQATTIGTRCPGLNSR